MSEKLREQIRNSFNQKDVYELLDIWKTNDRVEWSDMAFEVLREILRERMESVPPQDDPIQVLDEIAHDNLLEDWEVKLLDEENQPELYDPQKVLELRGNINKVAKAVIIVYVVLGLLNINIFRVFLQGTPLSFSEILQSFPNAIISILSVGIRLLVIYFPLIALNHILRILMQMEFNSRLSVPSDN